MDRLTFILLLSSLTLLLNIRIDLGFGRAYILGFVLGGGLVFYSTTLQFFFSYSNGVECNGLVELFFLVTTNF